MRPALQDKDYVVSHVGQGLPDMEGRETLETAPEKRRVTCIAERLPKIVVIPATEKPNVIALYEMEV